MEDLENREQPKMLETNPVGVNQNIENESIENKNVESVVEEQTNGSLGKFKDAESLLTAYNNLQAEFTRKCQKLKEFEKNEMQTPTLFEKEATSLFAKTPFPIISSAAVLAMCDSLPNIAGSF
ncbi:MAG: hypothetical protein IKA31_04150, partial [Clostridia bacterium]|nr:hypothetical protein [Clostridia bacterium]